MLIDEGIVAVAVDVDVSLAVADVTVVVNFAVAVYVAAVTAAGVVAVTVTYWIVVAVAVDVSLAVAVNVTVVVAFNFAVTVAVITAVAGVDNFVFNSHFQNCFNILERSTKVEVLKSNLLIWNLKSAIKSCLTFILEFINWKRKCFNSHYLFGCFNFGAFGKAVHSYILMQ